MIEVWLSVLAGVGLILAAFSALILVSLVVAYALKSWRRRREVRAQAAADHAWRLKVARLRDDLEAGYRGRPTLTPAQRAAIEDRRAAIAAQKQEPGGVPRKSER